MSSIARWPLLALFLTACAASEPSPTQQFFRKVQAYCVDESSCQSLLEEARTMRESCHEDNSCTVLRRQTAWLQEETQKYRGARRLQEEEERQRVARAEKEERERQKEQEKAAKAEAEAQARRAADEQAENDWKEAKPDLCRAAASGEACAPLTRYLARRQDQGQLGQGPHDKEGMAVLMEFGPRVIAMLEDNWKDVKTASCRQPKTLADCNDVATYLFNNPWGKHAKDADAILVAADPTMRRLYAQWLVAKKRANPFDTSTGEVCASDPNEEPLLVRTRRGFTGKAPEGYVKTPRPSSWYCWRQLRER